MYPPTPIPEIIYIDIYWPKAPKILFSPILMIIIAGTFRNTSNQLKLYEIILFLTGSMAYYFVLFHLYADDIWTWKTCHRLNFYLRNVKFSDIVANSIKIINKNYKNKCKIYKISGPESTKKCQITVTRWDVL